MHRRPKKQFAKKSLGQNFLHDVSVRDGIIENAGDLNGVKVLEIGPGLGFLTTKLLQKKADLTAIELDDRAADLLESDLNHKPNFRLIRGNILEQSLDEVFGKAPYSIIANIPYNITAPIFRKVLEKTKNKPEYCIFMVQKEVAEKVCPTQRFSNKQVFVNAKVKRTLLSISVEVFAEPQMLFWVDRSCFHPIPRVDSAIIRFDIRKSPLVAETDLKDFFTVVSAGFSERRKKIGNVLPKYFGLDKFFLGEISPESRAEDLAIDDWIYLTNRFKEQKDQL